MRPLSVMVLPTMLASAPSRRHKLSEITATGPSAKLRNQRPIRGLTPRLLASSDVTQTPFKYCGCPGAVRLKFVNCIQPKTSKLRMRRWYSRTSGRFNDDFEGGGRNEGADTK